MKAAIKSSFLLTMLLMSSCDSPQLWVDLLYLSVDVANIIQYERNQKELAKQPPLIYEGRCIEPCYLSTDYLDSGYEVPVYIGNDPDVPWINRENILLHPEINRWECRFDAEDCSNWKRVTIPQRDTTLLIVTDTTLIKDYELIFIPIPVKELKEGNDWREVLCPDAISEAIVRDMYDFLELEGYVDFKRKRYFTKALHEALIRYQQDNALPIGHIDAESLSAMGLGGYYGSREELW